MINFELLIHHTERLKRILLFLKEKYKFVPYVVGCRRDEINIQGDYKRLDEPIFELTHRKNVKWSERLQGEHLWITIKIGMLKIELTHD